MTPKSGAMDCLFFSAIVIEGDTLLKGVTALIIIAHGVVAVLDSDADRSTLASVAIISVNNWSKWSNDIVVTAVLTTVTPYNCIPLN